VAEKKDLIPRQLGEVLAFSAAAAANSCVFPQL
jgi:hypothetical protein